MASFEDIFSFLCNITGGKTGPSYLSMGETGFSVCKYYKENKRISKEATDKVSSLNVGISCHFSLQCTSVYCVVPTRKVSEKKVHSSDSFPLSGENFVVFERRMTHSYRAKLCIVIEIL